MFKNALHAMTVTAIILAGPAFAHAKLQSSVPVGNARLMESPKTLTLSFNEPVQLAVLKLKNSGKEIPVTIDRASKAAPTVTVTLPALGPGEYEVQWSALSPDDGHIMKGAFSFSVESPRPMTR